MTEPLPAEGHHARPDDWRVVLARRLAGGAAVLVICMAVIAVRSASFYHHVEQCFDSNAARYTISYDSETPMHRGVFVRLPGFCQNRGPFFQWFGSAFATVRKIKLDKPKPEHLLATSRWSDLEELEIPGGGPADEVDWHALGKIPFRNLRISSIGLEDHDLTALLSARSLVSLSVSNESAVTPAGFMTLKEHHALERLQLASSSGGESSEWCELLMNLKSLQSLMLSGPAMDDDVIAAIAQLPKLRKLYLDETVVTDRGLVALTDAPQLEHLVIRRAKITADGVAHLARSQSLRRLWITRCKLTAEDRDTLIPLFSECDVQITPMTSPQ